MGKQLEDMTLEELWELFPIELVAHDPRWADQYEDAEAMIDAALSAFPVRRISHIGSTAVEGIWSKPIVDVLVELEEGADIEEAAQALKAAGFIIMSSTPTRISLNYGYTHEGFAEEVFHVHLRFAGDNDELFFRDYLLDHDETAHAYEELKLRLWKLHEKDRDAYTEAKSDFVSKWTKVAKETYGHRY